MAGRSHTESALIEQHNSIKAVRIIQIRIIEHHQNILKQIHSLVMYLTVQIGQIKFL